MTAHLHRPDRPATVGRFTEVKSARWPAAVSRRETRPLRWRPGSRRRDFLSAAVRRRSSASSGWWASRPRFPSCLSLHSTVRLCRGT